jgi:hypothetical protein
MDCQKYIGMDVHQASISIAVRDATGKVVAESIIETKATTILEFIRGIKGSLSITFEEGTSAGWLYDGGKERAQVKSSWLLYAINRKSVTFGPARDRDPPARHRDDPRLVGNLIHLEVVGDQNRW